MTDYKITINEKEISSILFKDKKFKKLIESILNQILETQITEYIGAESYERNKNRKTYRNGYRTRKIRTRVGSLNLLVPQTRDGKFSTSIFRRYQRSEQAFVLGLNCKLITVNYFIFLLQTIYKDFL